MILTQFFPQTKPNTKKPSKTKPITEIHQTKKKGKSLPLHKFTDLTQNNG
jgi:hypothetical protein